jgi:hypothetical protein
LILFYFISQINTKGALESAQMVAQQTIQRSAEAAEYSAQLRTLIEHLGGLELQNIGEHNVQLLMTTVVPPVMSPTDPETLADTVGPTPLKP